MEEKQIPSSPIINLLLINKRADSKMYYSNGALINTVITTK
jgi:hypothetical protein